MSEQNNNRTKFLHLQLKPAEYEKIHREFNKTTCRKLSDYARKILLGKPLIAATRNQSLDDFMTEAIKLRHELNSIGNNFNQAVKKLHTLQQISDFRAWLINYELEKKILQNKMDEIKNYIQKIGEKWLQ
jgi:MobC-like protein